MKWLLLGNLEFEICSKEGCSTGWCRTRGSREEWNIDTGEKRIGR